MVKWKITPEITWVCFFNLRFIETHRWFGLPWNQKDMGLALQEHVNTGFMYARASERSLKLAAAPNGFVHLFTELHWFWMKKSKYDVVWYNYCTLFWYGEECCDVVAEWKKVLRRNSFIPLSSSWSSLKLVLYLYIDLILFDCIVMNL